MTKRTTESWEALLDGWVHDKQSDTLLGSWVRSTQIRKQEQAAPEAVAEVVRLRRALEQLRDMYDALATGDCAVASQHRNSRDALTRILNGDSHE